MFSILDCEKYAKYHCYRDLSQIYIRVGGRLETTELPHFNLPIVFISVDRIVNDH